ncbi:hypothetical protein BDR07DRAFT_1496628 [Suillus spraguei]|nr:hypothetical protein BDR07DRAFT_1496628 [Suillus spraguei]
MAREKSWLWDHFHQGSTKVNKVHWQACCKYCVKVKAKDLTNADQQAIAHGILQDVRTPIILMQEACDNVPHIAGKVEIMANHLLCYQYVPGNVKTNAETFKHGKKRQADDDDDEGPSIKPQLASTSSVKTVLKGREIRRALASVRALCPFLE